MSAVHDMRAWERVEEVRAEQHRRPIYNYTPPADRNAPCAGCGHAKWHHMTSSGACNGCRKPGVCRAFLSGTAAQSGETGA